jgi:hypothetical protein
VPKVLQEWEQGDHLGRGGEGRGRGRGRRGGEGKGREGKRCLLAYYREIT